MFGKELFILFNVRVFRLRLTICVSPFFPFDLEGVSDLIVLVPDYCRSYYIGIHKFTNTGHYLHITVWLGLCTGAFPVAHRNCFSCS